MRELDLMWIGEGERLWGGVVGGLKVILSSSLVFGGQYTVLVYSGASTLTRSADLWENILNIMKYIIVIFC